MKENMENNNSKKCQHLIEVKLDIKAKTPKGCQECLEQKLEWVALRKCLSCGHVGCCDSSVGKHAKKHFDATKHPIIEEFPDAGWRWCYIDEMYIN